MADVSIANLPALVGTNAPFDLLVMVDISDTSESPQGTTKKVTFNQMTINAISGNLDVNGTLTVGSPNTDDSPVLIVVDNAGTPKWGLMLVSGTANLNFRDFTTGTSPMYIESANGVVHTFAGLVVGADPANAGEIFRVGGSIRAKSMALQDNTAEIATLQINNTNALSQGLSVNAGGISGRFIAQFANYNTVIKCVVDDPAGQAGAMAILVFSQDVGSLVRIRSGPAGSGPGGSGRALYI